MVITSVNKPRVPIQYKSTQFRYGLTYVAITFVVLLFLNIYSAKVSQELFYNSKETSMIEKCLLTSTEISNREVLSAATVSQAVSQLDSLKVTRLIVTDRNAIVIYDSFAENSMVGKYALFPEIVRALEQNDVFSWTYHDGAMASRAATPIMTYGTLIGCVYMMEDDVQQGQLIKTLQHNIFIISLILEIAVILVALLFSTAFTTRLRKIMISMRIIREGDYSHRVSIGGNDELTVLGSEFNDLVERLNTSEQKRNNFVSDASHELKTPLASIKLLSDSILQNDMDIETVREFVGDIGNEADRLNRMSQKLLSLSRIEDQSDSDCEIVYFAPTVEKVVRMLSPYANESEIRIDTDLSDDCSILILEDDLYQIIFNLVENGIKYNIPGGCVSVHVERSEDNALLTVSDTGSGIPMESLPHIFERFYRVDKARARKSGGSGLGLSIVRNMVERNNGEIHVESTENQGTTFTVSFPVFDMEESV